VALNQSTNKMHSKDCGKASQLSSNNAKMETMAKLNVVMSQQMRVRE
jgi:hypothetical protein